jgi:hypothetical protein
MRDRQMSEVEEMETANDLANDDRLDAQRYRRLRVLGVAPSGSKHLEEGNVLRFTNLDEYTDRDIRVMPSRGEARCGQRVYEGTTGECSCELPCGHSGEHRQGSFVWIQRR